MWRPEWRSWYSNWLRAVRFGDRTQVGGRDLPHPSRPVPMPIQPPYIRYRGAFSGVEGLGRGVKHPPHLAPRLGKGRFGLRCFGTAYQSHLQGSWTSWPLKMGPIRCSETAVNNCHATPRNPRRAQIWSTSWRDGSLKLRVDLYLYFLSVP
jgi:hypothetical protein